MHEPSNRRPTQRAWANNPPTPTRCRTTCRGGPSNLLRKGVCGLGGVRIFGVALRASFTGCAKSPQSFVPKNARGPKVSGEALRGSSVVSKRGSVMKADSLSAAPCDCLNKRHPRGVGLWDGISQPHPPQETRNEARTRLSPSHPRGPRWTPLQVAEGGGASGSPPTPSLDQCL